jgi:peptidoglycan/xylan/chitin deacetylase (PgdA/CDA1 family)
MRCVRQRPLGAFTLSRMTRGKIERPYPMTNLWSANAPAGFWLCEPNPSAAEWEAAVQAAEPILGLPVEVDGIDQVLDAVLGEGQFGPNRWRLSRAKRAYYAIKPALPRAIIQALRRKFNQHSISQLDWPIEERYVRFQWEVLRQVLIGSGASSVSFRHFWPAGARFALVLTHDIETAQGQAHVRAVADLEERLGFCSSFNFVPERYSVDRNLMAELCRRGFEVGCHGLKHDGKLFSSQAEFQRRADQINHYLKDFNAVGFRAPLVHRQPEWMQILNIEYDLSFFDTDPYEAMPGGTMSIWPFFVGRFVELPYTLAQDFTVAVILGETTPRLWLEKLEFIERCGGMALVNSHPDYLRSPTVWKIYAEFLEAMQKKQGYWHALPCETARWWRARSEAVPHESPSRVAVGKLSLTDDGIELQ